MGNAQPNNTSSTSSSTTASHKQASHPANGHSHSNHKQPTSPPYSLAYYSEALSRQDLSPAFFLSSPLVSPRPRTAPSSSLSFDLIAYADIARLLLSSNATLSLWRYKLVPARISEYLFWRCLFQQLDAQHPDYQTYEQQAQQQQQQQEQQSHTYSQQSQLQTESTAAASAATAATEREIESLKAQLASLQHHIADLTTQLHNQHNTHTQHTATDQSTVSAHRGRWQPDKNTLEFFALDESLQSTLRQQKERRLDDVRREMRWIVDGDRVEDGPGRWECCGKEEWSAEGCKQ